MGVDLGGPVRRQAGSGGKAGHALAVNAQVALDADAIPALSGQAIAKEAHRQHAQRAAQDTDRHRAGRILDAQHIVHQEGEQRHQQASRRAQGERGPGWDKGQGRGDAQSSSRRTPGGHE